MTTTLVEDVREMRHALRLATEKDEIRERILDFQNEVSPQVSLTHLSTQHHLGSHSFYLWFPAQFEEKFSCHSPAPPTMQLPDPS